MFSSMDRRMSFGVGFWCGSLFLQWFAKFPPQKRLHHTIGLANCMTIPPYKGPASLCADPAEHFYLECFEAGGNRYFLLFFSD